MTTRDQIVAEARTWLNTPWQHQARLRGIGVDCAGLCLGVGWALGLIPKGMDETGYGREPDGTLLAIADKFANVVDTPSFGDVVVIAFEGRPMHFGILARTADGADSLIHAYATARKVVEHRLDATWRARVVRGYTYNGVA